MATLTNTKAAAAIAAIKMPAAATKAANKVAKMWGATAKAEAEYLDKRLALSVQVAHFWIAAEAAGYPNFKAACEHCKVKAWPGYESLKRLKAVGMAELQDGSGMAKLDYQRMKSTESTNKHRDGANGPGPLGKAMDKIRSLSDKAKSESLRTLAQETGHVMVSRDDATELAELRKDGAMPAKANAGDVIVAFKSLKAAERSAALAGILQVMGSLDGSK